MKSTDFLKENSLIVDGAMTMEQDHEVQMARSDLYNTARYAIELHKMLKNISEAEGLEGWVQSKITKAADYLAAVHEHILHNQVEDSEDNMDMFATESWSKEFDQLTNEMTSASVATAPAAGDKSAGTLFGGGYRQPKNNKKSSVIKRKA